MTNEPTNSLETVIPYLPCISPAAAEIAGYLNQLPNRDLALFLASEYGWYVFPCFAAPVDFAGDDGKPVHIGAKEPRKTHKGKMINPDGHNGASNEPEVIAFWWRIWPGSLVGINCKKSGILAVDCDAPGKPGQSHDTLKVNGVAEYARLMEANRDDELQTALGVQRTPSGGIHYLYSIPPLPGAPKVLADGIDLKYEGYICTGTLADGRCYTWEAAPDKTELDTLPPLFARQYLADALAKKTLAKVEKAQKATVKAVTRPEGQITAWEDFNARAEWADILKGTEDAGSSDYGDYLTRPGKKSGVSACKFTDGGLLIWSTAWPGLPAGSYSKFTAYSALNFAGNHKAAAAALEKAGYGRRK